jgi:hypothetical protein
LYVQDQLKVPDEGAWIALTRVDADGTITRLGYISHIGPFAAAEIDELDVDRDGIFRLRLRPDAERVNLTITTRRVL